MGRFGATLERRPTTWGDNFRAAFVQAREHFGRDYITYQKVADRVAQVVPCHQTTVLRLTTLDDPPHRANERQHAYLVLVAMGFDPTEFGLTDQDRLLKGMDEATLRRVLDPGVPEKNGSARKKVSA